ncbi:type I-U CRISPR-associated protein Cas5/Cas6 [Schaalia sp. 19OD2882]|uniref:type I-G CRISPR-associated protein Csb2 n=1 Tax=Schaalia sp. 19OD2882 TaxID=2794089 RepID=UPI001C1EEABF|nr:type I-U CRISPR-associated protein Csb2 [Schaalia sp. 19OD2882]QWW19375.1 type I-U CRISPR-associated protein Cas5/Cas6 [Schaalia sp. 19OD2882]
MPSIGIQARFPLGVYHGHTSDGSPDPFPTPVRLFSALFSAACTGSSATPDGQASAEALEALAWLEGHSPEGLLFPATMPVGEDRQTIVSYRYTGAFKNGKEPKKASKAISDGMAVHGAVGWTWSGMSDRVRDTLAVLCEDVPHLGEMDSPVILEVTEMEPNWVWDPDATAFSTGGRQIPVPVEGRMRVLEELHAQERPTEAPSASDDKMNQAEAVRVFPVSTKGVELRRYGPNTTILTHGSSPWRDALVMSVDSAGSSIPSEQRLDWCVAFHKALISRIGNDAPAIVTGHYDLDVPLPANRIAIQYLPASLLNRSQVLLDEGISGVFLVMLPGGMTSDDLGAVFTAFAGMTRLRSRWGALRLRPHDELVSASTFWKPCNPGSLRLWSPTPVAVPEVTRQRGEWTFEDAIMLSLGFVWRDELGPVSKGSAGYRTLVDRVREKGPRVVMYHRVVKHPSAYAHRMPQGMVAQPYIAQIDAGRLFGEQELVAIGQSRHLGGGLLVPIDVPAEFVRGMER